MAARKRKEQQRKQRTREALLAAAQRVFTKQGYFNTLISDIVADAGVGQGTFYRYFSNKREIFEVLFDGLVEQALALFAPMSAKPPTTLAEYRSASLTAALRGLTFLTEQRELTLLFLREGTSIDADFEKRLQGVYDQFALLAQSYLDHAIAHGFARSCRSEIVSQAIVGVVLRMISLHGTGRLGEVPVDELAGEIIDFAFSGFGKE